MKKKGLKEDSKGKRRKSSTIVNAQEDEINGSISTEGGKGGRRR